MRMYNFSGIIMLTMCSLIWGTAFIAQSVGAEYLEPLTFNCARSILAALFLLPCFLIFDKLAGKPLSLWGTEDAATRQKLLRGGVICGVALAIASLFQQIGMAHTTVGKAGFITSLYIVIVPILGMLFFKNKVNILQWISVVIATVGMYFICINEAFTINKGDMFILTCAFCFTIHILCIENVISGLDGVRLSFIQLFVCALINGVLMFIFETPSWKNLSLSWEAVAYAGIMSSGVAYTLQIIGQKHVSSVIASMLMSLESVFAMLSGWLLLGQVLTTRELWGCALVFVAIILAQVPMPAKKSALPFS